MKRGHDWTVGTNCNFLKVGWPMAGVLRAIFEETDGTKMHIFHDSVTGEDFESCLTNVEVQTCVDNIKKRLYRFRKTKDQPFQTLGSAVSTYLIANGSFALANVFCYMLYRYMGKIIGAQFHRFIFRFDNDRTSCQIDFDQASYKLRAVSPVVYVFWRIFF